MNIKELKIELLKQLIQEDREDLSESDVEIIEILAYDEDIENELQGFLEDGLF